VSASADERKTQENRVKPLIKKLTNKSDVYKDLPFEILSIEEQVKLIHFLLEKTPERQIVANVRKTDVDRDYSRFILTDDEKERFSNEFLNSIGAYNHWNSEADRISNRDLIRDFRINTTEVLDKLDGLNIMIHMSLVDEINMLKALGIRLECMANITNYIDYVSDGILQLINYRVIVAEQEKSKLIIQALINEFGKLMAEIDAKIKKERQQQRENDHLSAEIITSYFSYYRTHYSRYYEELKIFDILKTEVADNPLLFCPVQDQYRAEKILIPEDQINGLQDIITEGMKTCDFRSKMCITREFIEIMSNYGGRSCYPNCVQDLKVYYREIFISKLCYKRKQASTIVQDYIDACKQMGYQSFENDRQGHYMFVREKVTRGYFREKNILDCYFTKADFQKALYDALLSVYLLYDYRSIIDLIYTINQIAICKLSEVMG